MLLAASKNLSVFILFDHYMDQNNNILNQSILVKTRINLIHVDIYYPLRKG